MKKSKLEENKKLIIIENKLYKLYNEYRKYYFIEKELSDYYKKEIEKYNINIKDVERYCNQNNSKWYRIRKRIKYMNKNNIWFGTLTIEDKNMNKDHKRKIKDLYRKYNYIANIDYGTKTNRKHYHIIIESKEEPQKWNYGFCNFKKVYCINNIEKYLVKIYSHILKASTKQENIIYSRLKDFV